MFSRILNIKKEKVVTPCEDLSSRKSVKIEKDFQAIPSKLPILDKDKIRVLIYKDAEPRGDRTLLFDSDALQSAAINEQSESKKEKSKEQEELKQNTELKTKFKLKKPSSDVKMLGEMIFGSVAMIYKGAIVKIHIIRSPPQLLMTKVFALRSRNHEVNLCDSNMSLDSIHMWQSDSADSSSSESIMRTLSKSSAVSHPIPTPVQPSFLSKSKSVNGYSLSDCYKSSSLVSEKSMSSPNGCLQTRFHRFQKTSLDLPNLWRSKSESSDEGTYKQQPKIGIGIIFKQWNTAEENKAFQTFFFSHFALIEWHLQALRIKIEKSFYLHNNFMKASIVGVECFKEDILNLFYTPRILEPTWLSLMTSDDTHNIENVNSFMESFMSIASVCEKKETNYFLSILLTAVLSHHTSWVATVMSSGLTSKRAFMDKHSSKAVAVLAKCHPYNPLWAQLCDMYGSISVPLKLARTVIVGQNKTFVCQLLQVLTYFIRCSDVKETIMQMVPEEEKQNSSNHRKKRDSLDTSYMTFGRSLLAGYSENYTSNFVLQGVAKLNKEKLAMDLKNSVQYSVLDEVASDAICIVANVDNWTCETWSLTRRTNSSNLSISESLNTKSVFASDLVSSLVESTKGLWELKFSPNSCLLHVEEQLKDIYNRGKVLVEFAKLNPENVLSAYVQSSGYHSNDVDLLTAVGSTYTFNDGNVF